MGVCSRVSTATPLFGHEAKRSGRDRQRQRHGVLLQCLSTPVAIHRHHSRMQRIVYSPKAWSLHDGYNEPGDGSSRSLSPYDGTQWDRGRARAAVRSCLGP